MDVVNLLEGEWEGSTEREGWRLRWRSVCEDLGLDLIGGTLYELDPGQKSFPFHYHYAQEEAVLVLTGTPTVRGADGERRLRPGDFVPFKRGPEGGHQLRNDGDEPCRVLFLSGPGDREVVDVVVYPESGKVASFAVSPRHERFAMRVREQPSVDYWDNEE